MIYPSGVEYIINEDIKNIPGLMVTAAKSNIQQNHTLVFMHSCCLAILFIHYACEKHMPTTHMSKYIYYILWAIVIQRGLRHISHREVSVWVMALSSSVVQCLNWDHAWSFISLYTWDERISSPYLEPAIACGPHYSLFWVNIGTKPLPERNVELSSMELCAVLFIKSA